MTKLVLSCAFVCALLTPCAVQAQALYGSIVGNVKDSSEAVVAGATVTLINVDTKQSRETTTSDTGGYDFATLLPGPYEMTVSRQGFTTSTRTSIEVTANNTIRVDITLHVGTVSESVTVSGAAPPTHGRVPAECTWASMPRTSRWWRMSASAIGERHALPVHTNRMSMRAESTSLTVNACRGRWRACALSRSGCGSLAPRRAASSPTGEPTS